MKENFLDELNQSQREAVLYNDGPSLVIAGAGSGKTRVLTFKIAYLMNLGLDPSRILALTFTNKAAREMKERIAQEVGYNRSKYLWMGTFHSIFSRILRVEADKIGFTRDFTIYDASDSKSLIKSIIKEMGLDDKTYKPSAIAGIISSAKNHLVTPGAYRSDRATVEADERARIPKAGLLYQTYVDRCRKANAMDFDDLLVYTYFLFSKNEDVRRQYADRFEYVMVDEYQDTNVAQHKIVWKLTKDKQRVCVVGDDAQSIYSFRGANIENILGFTKQYNCAKVFKLEQNYRSTQTIVNAANSVIAKNSNQIDKNVFSENKIGEPIEVYNTYSDREEGITIVKRLREYYNSGERSYKRFAILYRTNAQSRIFEDELMRNNIPYRIYGGLSFYQRKEIKDVIAYLRMAINPNDEEALKRIINYPARGIGETTIKKVSACAVSNEVSMWNVLSEPVKFGLDVNKGTLTKLQNFQDLIFGFQEAAKQMNASEIGLKIISESGILKDLYAEKNSESQDRLENIEELKNALASFVEERQEQGIDEIMLPDFLSEVSLISDLDESDDGGDKVTLMTIHSAKGLEFDTVFVVGMEENLFPSAMSYESPRAIEEERRLFYVAITRAEKNCVLSFARSRFRFGSMEFSSPSRFLRELDPKCIRMMGGSSFGMEPSSEKTYGGSPFGRSSGYDEDVPEWMQKSRIDYSKVSQVANSAKRVVQPRQTDFPPRKLKKVVTPTASVDKTSVASLGGLSVGDRIAHERFGEGRVVELLGSADSAKAKVQFVNAGEKTLLLKFAKFKKI
ncbi:MAG: UvrD-helicase domain-containing protein [Bacteroidaceae bacterium]|nr:UvrD-helicase domain-containing protein [Bacteroidaceae bacterium]